MLQAIKAIFATMRVLSVTTMVMASTGTALAQDGKSLLDAILARGALRVGTTGDYPPFSELDQATNTYRGYEIDVATQLARDYPEEVEAVYRVRRFMHKRIDGKSAHVKVEDILFTFGLIIGAIFSTGLSVRITQGVMSIAQDDLWLILLLSAVIALVLGTGLTASAVYITMVATVVPLLKAAGVPTVAAHMFAFYYGVVSDITPPTALAAVATSSSERYSQDCAAVA